MMTRDEIQRRHSLGRRAEQFAEAHYLKQGSRLVARNFRCQGGEVDLIFEEPCEATGLELVFVEVRARTEGGWVDALETVTFPKQMRLVRAIRLFLAKYRGHAKQLRVDIIAFSPAGETDQSLGELRQIKNVGLSTAP